jgi:hypothetical protein
MNSLKTFSGNTFGMEPLKKNDSEKEIKPQVFPPDCPVTSPGQKQDNDTDEENPQQLPSPDPGRLKIYFTHKAEIVYFTQVPLQSSKTENT